ncbi:SfnB family sulfur acquisition oxidoreductase [Agrobacterium sp. SHOUNA12C]|uniref:Oxidoreductase n=1 Tax=Rhizobium rhizogenes NBRC 13257 TaxID=1220581 RepID=A0AA87QFJ0_RHIRH|nr:SfnB family sulfur acquisition oxidoreductase [Rhizobium rhizogenes]MCJ9723021.1 SfnB family sulfur acquisition oxidoreductase [Agrobacterium sp. BETTINA12B]MCJ9758397.1 SfnB family sulfur acquisition oxidoreductase [Agrobacterium sp. SHOUNA12C]NTF58234.1 SfnB family sulfur acquisition oxidoreductase [Rhizobium rhizogenes]NTF64646.1 SfnB family sulfur acquisition oxidoreductase [Rhizobium rhizogenes]NTF77816.1 SfnB family sulfur acquisition oxidoreductase [Rhizobium rhizogenes]
MTEINSPKPVSPAPPPSRPADIIRDDAQALKIAERLATDFAASASSRDSERLLPWAELDQYSTSGLWGITVPREYGGAGVSAKTVAQTIVTIGAADGSLSQIPQNHYYALEVLRVGGSAEQKAFFYERVLAGERLGNALAEIGQRDFKRRTRLVRDPGGWYVDGKKFYCTGAIYAHWIPTLVVAEEDGAPVTYLAFVPRDAPGVTIHDDWDGFGQRVTGSGTVLFERVRVEPEWVVPFQTSFERPTTIGPFAQIMHAAIDLGIGFGAYQEMLRFIRERARPWLDAKVDRATEDPLTLHQVGNVWLRLRAAQVLLDRAAAEIDAVRADMTEESVARASIAVAEAKILATKAGLLAANKLFELSGTSSTLSEDNFDRYWRNVRTHTLHDPVRWKYQAVGNYYLNGKLPPRHGAI